MLRKIITAAVMIVVSATTACRQEPLGGATGTPDPAFQGEVPQDAFVYEGEPGAYGGSLVLAQPTDMKTFNVLISSEVSSNDILWYHVFRCLVTYGRDDPPGFKPDLCVSWQASPDAKQWTFYLRKGVRWSDGQPFTSDDVEFSYNLILDDKTNSPLRDVFIEGRDASGSLIFPALEKLDDSTVRFDLHKPNSSFLDAIFNLWLVPKHKWEGAQRAGRFSETMKISDAPADVVGLGPFRIKEYVAGQRIVLERNPYFWKIDKNGQRLPYLDRIVFVITRDYNTILSKFQAGEIDVMERVRGEDYALVKRMESPDIKVEEGGISYDTNWIIFNQNTGNNPKTGKPFVETWKLRLFRNQKFRQAVSYAIDREGLANTVFAGRGVPIYSFVSPGDKEWYSDDVMKYPYDPGLARLMLAEIELKDSNGDGFIEDSEGHTVEVNINTNASNSQRVGTTAFIARNLRDVGIKANLAPLALNSIGTMLDSTHDFEAIALGWQIDVPGPSSAMNVLLSSGRLHSSFPNQETPSTDWEERIDQLVYQFTTTLDEAERKRIFAETQRLWSEQLPEINLISERVAIAYRNRFGNLRPSALPPRATWNCEEIYIKK